MKRGWIGAGILMFFLVLGWAVGRWMDKAHNQTGQLLQDAAQKALAGELEEGIEQAMQAKNRWEQQRHGTAIVADHTPMDDVDALFGEMEVYAAAGEAPHFAACCAELAQRIQAFAEAHGCRWWNIL